MSFKILIKLLYFIASSVTNQAISLGNVLVMAAGGIGMAVGMTCKRVVVVSIVLIGAVEIIMVLGGAEIVVIKVDQGTTAIVVIVIVLVFMNAQVVEEAIAIEARHQLGMFVYICFLPIYMILHVYRKQSSII